jgi:hypothetical protein
MAIEFSSRPGAWERHLQRKHLNPLFPRQSAVTQAEVEQARRRDGEEIQQFNQDLLAVLQKASELAPNEESEVILKLKDQIDELYVRCAGLAGEHGKEKQALLRLADIVMNAIRGGAANDPQAMAQLREEEQVRQLHRQLLESALVADLLRAQTPIAEDELVPTLLSEDQQALTQALYLFDDAQLRELCHGARLLLEQRGSEGDDLTAARQRLELLEQRLEQLAPEA